MAGLGHLVGLWLCVIAVEVAVALGHWWLATTYRTVGESGESFGRSQQADR
jgi:hypothetical protein